MSWLAGPGYDAWKTACCGRYPNCSNCPEDEDYDEDYAERIEDERADMLRDAMIDRELCG